MRIFYIELLKQSQHTYGYDSSGKPSSICAIFAILFNRRCSEPVQASSSVQAFVARLSKVGYKMVNVVN